MSTPRQIELIIAADEPALFYDSTTAAERALEAVDVRDGVYGPIYGPTGEVYRIDIAGDRVVIVHDKSKPNDPDGLRQVITDFLRQVMPGENCDVDLKSLLRHCERYLQPRSGKSDTNKV